MRVRYSAVAVILLAAVAPQRAIAASASSGEPPYVPGRLIFKVTEAFAPDMRAAARAQGPVVATGAPAFDRLLQRDGARDMRAPFAERHARVASLAARFPRRAPRASGGAVPRALDRIFIVELSPDLDMEQIAREYAHQPGVEWAEPDRKAYAVFVPNDPYFSSSGSWGQSFRDLWGLVTIAAPAAWDVTRGAGTLVAVIDTGVDAAHPDLAAHMWSNAGEIPGNAVDDDGNGFVDDVGGWDSVNGDNDPFDDNGHGTHCAGTIAAIGNNALGITGVAWESSVMALKGLSAFGAGAHSWLAESILYAADNGADVISASWGGGGQSQLLQDAIATAHDAGVVFVAAAGNNAGEASAFYPAAYTEAIAVAASDHLDRLAFFSNRGARIDVGAPGGGDDAPPEIEPFRSILSLRSSGSRFDSRLHVSSLLTRQAGTSMAAPHVSGVAALVLAAQPSFTPEQVRQALRTSADDVATPGFDLQFGYGRLNAARAVLVTNALTSRITSPSFGATVDGVVSVSGTASGPGFASYTLEYGLTSLPTTWQPIASAVTPVDAGILGTWDLSTVPDGAYVLRLRARTIDDQWFEDRIPVVLDHVSITSPARGDVVGAGGGPIEVRGTAAGVGFVRYFIHYRIIAPPDAAGLVVTGGWTNAGVTLVGGGTAPVTDGLLATIDPGALPGPREIDVRMQLVNTSGSTFDEVLHVAADPTLRAGWPRRLGPTTQRNVTLADLDGDGGKEILFVNQGEIHVLRSDGSSLPGWPQIASSDTLPSVADMDGDLQPEVVTFVASNIDIRHGDGTLMTTITAPFPYYNPGPITLADIDGDGGRDIVYTARNSTESWLWAVRVNDSVISGFPARWRCNVPGVPCFEAAVAVGDTDADGSRELAVVMNDDRGRQYLRTYDAHGELTRAPKKIKTKRRFVNNFPIMADLNGDGALDVAVNDEQTKLTAFAGSGRKIRLPRGAKLPGHAVKYGSTTYGSRQEPLTAGDLDGDGLAELFVGRSYPASSTVHGEESFLLPPYRGVDYVVAVGRELAPPVWSVALPYEQAEKSYGPGAAAVGDVDGDGRQDVVVGTGMSVFWDAFNDPNLTRVYTVYAFRDDGIVLPGFPKPTSAHGTDKQTTPALGDLDGDGLKEIVWIDGADNLLVWTIPGTPGPENMQWPMYRHDAAHTGALVNGP